MAMATLIKPTPTLHGKDAKKFLDEMDNLKIESKENLKKDLKLFKKAIQTSGGNKMNTKKISEAIDFFHQEARARLDGQQFDVAIYCMKAQEAAFTAYVCVKELEKKNIKCKNYNEE